jgi:hypothetical protein
MQFHELYKVQPGDTLGKIGLGKGYSNPGPIAAYPPNQGFFKGRSPNLIRPNDKFLIPWHPNKLRKLITWLEALVQDVTSTANKMINEEIENKEELEDFLLKIDAAGMLLTFFVAGAFLAREGAVVASEEIPKGAEEAAKASEKIDKAMVKWFSITHGHLAADVILMSVPTPTPPAADWKFFTRHVLGVLSPSYWASVVVAVKEGDVGIFYYGSQWTSYKDARKIADNAKLEIIKLQAPLRHARFQLDMPFYKNRV